MRHTSFFFLALCLCILSIGCKRVPIPTYNYEVGKSSEIRPLTQKEMRDIIVNSCFDKGWTARDISDELIEASVLVRQKHRVTVNINYSSTGYKITYLDSENMKYKRGRDGAEYIHQSYVKWVNNLEVQIKRRIMQASTVRVQSPSSRKFRNGE